MVKHPQSQFRPKLSPQCYYHITPYIQYQRSPRDLAKKERYAFLGLDHRNRQPMRSVAARSSRWSLRGPSDWLLYVLKLGDPDLAPAVFPACAGSAAFHRMLTMATLGRLARRNYRSYELRFLLYFSGVHFPLGINSYTLIPLYQYHSDIHST